MKCILGSLSIENHHPLNLHDSRMGYQKTKSIYAFFILTFLAFLLCADPTFAVWTPTQTQANSTIGNVLCGVAQWFWGNTGKGIACVAISILGIGAMLGKTSWGLAMVVGTGIALVFGGPRILDNLYGVPPGYGPGVGWC